MALVSGAFRPGWLMYAGSLGGIEGAVAGDAYAVNISVDYERFGGMRVRLDTELSRALVVQKIPREQAMWEALQRWPDEQAGRRWPADMEALHELAKRHPEEYAELREAVAVLRALGGR